MPLAKQIHIDRALEDVSIAYQPNEMIAQRATSTVPVKHLTNKYFVYSTDIQAIPETLRTSTTVANRATFTVSTSTYSLEKHSLKEAIGDDDRDNADKAIRLDIDTTEFLTRKILLRHELSFAQMVQTTTSWSNNASLAAAAAWNANTTASNPIIQIDSGTSKIISSSGYKPNTLIVDDPTFRALKEHVSIVDRVKYVSIESVGNDLLAKLFDIDMLFVGRAIYEAAEEGLASSMQPIYTDNATLAYVERAPGLRKASAFYTFRKMNEGGNPFRVKRWRDEEIEGDWIEVTSHYQHRAVATAAAYLWRDTVQ